MNQPPNPPQESTQGQHLYGQQQWKQDLPPDQLAVYNQLSQSTPGHFQQSALNNVHPPKRPSSVLQWYQSRTKKVKLSIGGGMILAVLLFFSCIATAVGSLNPVTQPTPSTNQAGLLMRPAVAHLPTPMITPSPTSTFMPKPAIAPTYAPQPTSLSPTSTPCPGVNCNPWGYTFSPGDYIYSAPSAFCTYFSCINNFLHGHGYVVECQDGEYSKAGGMRTACSDQGGVLRPLYSH